MHTSKRCEYGLRALIDIALAHEQGRAVLPIAEIAEHERIPVKFLEQILLQLKEAGYLESKRGKHGGYALALSPKKIRMGEIVRLVDGPLAPISCVSKTAYEPCSCPDEEHCGLRLLMLEVRNSIAAILDRETLHDVVAKTVRHLRRDGSALPFVVREGAGRGAASARKARRDNRG